MFELQIEGEPFQLDELQRKLETLPARIASELTAWQVADMHRRQPNTVFQNNAVQTSVTPTEKPRRSRTLRRRPKSKRPILRDALFDQLTRRMSNLLETLSWQ